MIDVRRTDAAQADVLLGGNHTRLARQCATRWEMPLGRRSVGIHDASRWVFNRVAERYSERPPYPVSLVDALSLLTPPDRRRVLDIGAGTGHLALPLAERGFDVTAVEPAEAMLAELRRRAADRGASFRALHGAAEALPVDAGSADLVVVADAVHFLDVELTSREVRRVLHADGALAIVVVEPADTPFMNAVRAVMESAAPRRPRDMSGAVAELLSPFPRERRRRAVFEDRTPVDAERLERILRTISYIGPAMNPDRAAAFRARILALPGERVWARRMTLHAATRGR